MKKIAAAFFLILLTFLTLYSLPKVSVPDGKVLFLTSDLTKTIVAAIDRAQESVFLSIYNLSDKKVLSALNRKVSEGVRISFYTDAHASWHELELLHPAIKVHLWKRGALMHRKILVIDRHEIFFGSANFSWNSLNLHPNLILAFKNEEVAGFLIDHLQENATRSSLQLQIGGQAAEVFMLPAKEDLAKKVAELIHQARKCIKVAMYTWTRNDFALCLANAKLKGIDVQVVIDRSNEKRTPSTVLDTLFKAHIGTWIYQGAGLMHHKFLWIDDDILLSGSANWTKGAFIKNCEANILLNNLTEDQKEVMHILWNSLKKDSKQFAKN